MSTKKTVTQDDDVNEEAAVTTDGSEVKAVKKQEPGTVVKTYIQNGLGYKRVIGADGISTVDMRA